MQKGKLITSLCISMFLSTCAFASIRYSAPMNEHAHALWSTKVSKLSCSLSYAIPEFGRADFYVSSGREKTISFELFPIVSVGSDSLMRILELSPEWRTEGIEREIGRIKLYKGFNPFVGDTVSRRMLNALYKGLEIAMPYNEKIYATYGNAQGQSIIPTMSPLGFTKKYKEFNECQRGLFPYSFVDVNVVTCVFIPGSDIFVTPSLKSIKDQIEYIKLDESVKAIKISVFTFGQGDTDANKALSQKRVKAIEKLYTDSGIDKNMLTFTEYNNENLATTKRVDEKEQIEARKVVVTLERDPVKIKYDKELNMPDIGVEKF